MDDDTCYYCKKELKTTYDQIDFTQHGETLLTLHFTCYTEFLKKAIDNMKEEK